MITKNCFSFSQHGGWAGTLEKEVSGGQDTCSRHGEQNLLHSQLYIGTSQLYKKVCILSYWVSSQTLPLPEGKKRQEVSILDISRDLPLRWSVLLGLQDRKRSYWKHGMKQSSTKLCEIFGGGFPPSAEDTESSWLISVGTSSWDSPPNMPHEASSSTVHLLQPSWVLQDLISHNWLVREQSEFFTYKVLKSSQIFVSS